MAKYDHICGVCGLSLLIIFGFQSILAQGQGQGKTPGNGDIRLVGGNSSQGRVEIYFDGQWGTVCDDMFGSNEAIVVCRQLNMSSNGAQVTLKYANGTGIIWMDDVKCDATSRRLELCQHVRNNSDCTHKEDVGVICPTSAVSTGVPLQTTTTQAPVVPGRGNCTTPDPNVRLMQPANRPYMGVVQIFKNNQWGTVCDNKWDLNDAKVVCSMLCYDPDDALPGGPSFAANITEPMMVENVECTGQETSILDCPQSDWSKKNCSAAEKASVTCAPLDNSVPSKPQPVLECTDGHLTATFSTLRDPYLEAKHLLVAKTYTGPCNVKFSNGTNSLAIKIPFDECGTERTYNATHIIYNTIIKYLPTHSGDVIQNRNTYMVHVTCDMPRSVRPNQQPIVPLTETVTQASSGTFTVQMSFFENNNFKTEVTDFPLEIPLGRFLSSGLTLGNVDKNLMLVVPSCYATPSSNREDTIRYPLFTDKCANDPTITLYPINNTFMGMRLQVFRFVQFSEVYIHCDAIVCGNDEASRECDRSCVPSTTATSARKKRRKRSLSHPVIHVSSPTIIVYDPTNPAEIIREPVHTTNMPSTTKKYYHSTTKGANLPPVNNTIKGDDTVVTKGDNFVTRRTSISDTNMPPTTVPSTQKPEMPKGDDTVVTKGDNLVTRKTSISDSNVPESTGAPPPQPSELPMRDYQHGTNGSGSMHCFTLTSLLLVLIKHVIG